MKEPTQEIVDRCKELTNQGLNRDDLIAYLHQEGATIMESLKVLMQVFGLSLGDAKQVVSAHPVWKDTVAAAAPLHEELEKEIERKTGKI
jgi:ribosomal protein L7/L12